MATGGYEGCAFRQDILCLLEQHAAKRIDRDDVVDPGTFPIWNAPN